MLKDKKGIIIFYHPNDPSPMKIIFCWEPIFEDSPNKKNCLRWNLQIPNESKLTLNLWDKMFFLYADCTLYLQLGSCPHHHHQLISLTNTFNNPRFNSSTKAFSHSNHGLFHLKLLLHLSFFQKSIFFITSSFRFEFKKSLGHDFAKHSLHSNYSTKIYMYHPPQSSTPPRYQSISNDPHIIIGLRKEFKGDEALQNLLKQKFTYCTETS